MQEPNDTNNKRLTPSLGLFVPSIKIIRDNLFTLFFLLVIPSLVFSAIFAFEIGFTVTPAVGSVIENVSFTPEFWAIAGATAIYTLFTIAPLTYTYVQASKGREVSLGEAFSKGTPFLPRLIVLSFVTSIMIVLGLLLFIVPGIILLRRYYLASYYLVDQNLSISEAMNRSAAESKLYSGSIYGLFGVTILITLFSIIPVFGSYISNVLELCYAPAAALRYREIQAAVEA